VTDAFDRVERQLGVTLLSWGAGSVVAGGVIRLAAKDPTWKAFGTQTAMWGAVDVAIALAAHLRAGRRTEPTDHNDRKKLHRALLVNSVLDVGYIAGGLTVRGRADRLSVRMRRKRSAAQLRGDGVAIVMQGAALLALDTSYAVRTRNPL
jgi:hypothetical protein